MHPQRGGTSSLLPCPNAATNAQLDYAFDLAVTILHRQSRSFTKWQKNQPYTRQKTFHSLRCRLATFNVHNKWPKG